MMIVVVVQEFMETTYIERITTVLSADGRRNLIEQTNFNHHKNNP